MYCLPQVSELFSGSQFDILSPLRGWRWAVLRRMQAVWEQSQVLQPLQASLNIKSSTTFLALWAGPSTSSIWSSRFLLHSLIPWHSNVNNRTFLAFILHQHYIKSSDLNHMTVADIENSFAFLFLTADSALCWYHWLLDKNSSSCKLPIHYNCLLIVLFSLSCLR